MTSQGKLLRTTNQGTSCFVKSLPLPIETNGSKIFFIAISFYHNIACQDISCE